MIVVSVIAVLALLGLAASVRILKQYERGVQFRLGRVRHAIDRIDLVGSGR